jgi:hypothetical protein
MNPRRIQQIASLLVAALLLSPVVFAFELRLSDEAVREAYFLGQRNDERTAEFLAKYRRHLPIPETGPYVSTVELFTPYAEAVDFSRQRSFGYSAQDAAQDYRKRGDLIRVSITIEFTPTYGYLIERQVKHESNTGKGLEFRSPSFWKDFTYRLAQGDNVIEPLDMQGHATYSVSEDSVAMTGAVILLVYDAEKIASSCDAAVEVDTPDGQHVVANFDLATLK